MEAVRRANPRFVNFNSRTAIDAVEQFCRMQRNGLAAQRIPEALIECARSLNDAQMDMFEQWIVNPQDVTGIDASVIGKENLKEHLLIVAEHEQKCEEPLVNEDELVMPALEACSDEDEKCAKE